VKDSKFWWVHVFCDEEMDDRWEIRDKKDESVICGIKCDGFESIPAPLTDEILKVLPAEIGLGDNFYSLVIIKNKKYEQISF
jgi:hypothetical protein